MFKFINLTFLVFLISFSSFANDAVFGIGVGAVDVRHYMGAGQYYQVALPFPYFKDTMDTEKSFYFDIDMDFTLPVDSEAADATGPAATNSFKNYDRKGMASIPASLYLGIKLGVRLGDFDISGKVTRGAQLNGRWTDAGVLSKVTVETPLFSNDHVNLSIYTHFIYSNEVFNHIFYSVEDNQVTAERAAYDAKKSGYLGSDTGLLYSHKIGSITYLGFFNIETMQSSVVKDSPLVKKPTNTGFGFGLAYQF
jgi:outer membrane scaffolding protein for murein synthesis (MipA/OmpV family)